MHGNRLAARIPMTTSPDSAERRSEHNAQRPDAPDEANGIGHNGSSMDVRVRSTERRRRPPPPTPEGYLYQLPALVLLDRLPIPMLAIRLDGFVTYNNPAFATMLGHRHDTLALIDQPLSTLLDGHSATPPRDCLAALCAAHNHDLLVDWLHAEGFPVRSVVSESVFVRATDQILLIGVTDMTEMMWAIHPDR
jgi:hypothetical protein